MLLGLAEAVLFLLPGISSRPGHELRGAALIVPIALAVATLVMLDARLLRPRGSVDLLGAAVTWVVALGVSWIAALPIGPRPGHPPAETAGDLRRPRRRRRLGRVRHRPRGGRGQRLGPLQALPRARGGRLPDEALQQLAATTAPVG